MNFLFLNIEKELFNKFMESLELYIRLWLYYYFKILKRSI